MKICHSLCATQSGQNHCFSSALVSNVDTVVQLIQVYLIRVELNFARSPGTELITPAFLLLKGKLLERFVITRKHEVNQKLGYFSFFSVLTFFVIRFFMWIDDLNISLHCKISFLIGIHAEFCIRDIETSIKQETDMCSLWKSKVEYN